MLQILLYVIDVILKEILSVELDTNDANSRYNAKWQ